MWKSFVINIDHYSKFLDLCGGSIFGWIFVSIQLNCQIIYSYSHSLLEFIVYGCITTRHNCIPYKHRLSFYLIYLIQFIHTYNIFRLIPLVFVLVYMTKVFNLFKGYIHSNKLFSQVLLKYHEYIYLQYSRCFFDYICISWRIFYSPVSTNSY